MSECVFYFLQASHGILLLTVMLRIIHLQIELKCYDIKFSRSFVNSMVVELNLPRYRNSDWIISLQVSNNI